MKKKKLNVLVVCLICLFIPSTVYAHPGRTNSSGCHECKTNCEQWGLKYGEYHCHDNGTSGSNSHSSQNNSNNNTNNQPTISKETSKSSDNTLKSITIDGEKIKISDQMNYKTKNEKIDILVETNDSKATYNIDKNSLKVGINTINIKVTAENGNEKNYSILVNRKKLSNNTNIKIIINDENVNFNLGKANVKVSSDTENLNYKYEIENKDSQVSVDGDKNLKFGENIVTFTVTAEDGTEAKYELTVNKYTKSDEIIETILGFTIIAGIVYGIYYFFKKQKKN